MSRPEFETSTQRPEDLRQDIDAQKDAIAGTLSQLDRKMKRATDWRTPVADHPYLAVGVALGAGALLSGMFRRKPTPRERIIDALAESVEDITDQVRDRFVSKLSRGLASGAVRASAIALAARMAAGYLGNKWNLNSAERDVRDL